MAAHYDLVIRHGLMVDGTGASPRLADVAVINGIIVAVGKVAGAGREEIDATGLLVTPPGYKADLNVIDHAALAVHAPRIVDDLPGGGRRLNQEATGYRWTIVGGEVIARDDQPTGALPGRLVRGAQRAAAMAVDAQEVSLGS